jgi:protein gp37
LESRDGMLQGFARLLSAHCYAETFAERWRGIPGHPYEQGFDLRFWPERLEIPLRWKRPRMIFVNSMSDLFHEEIPAAYIDRVFDVMRRAPQHVFQVLTKRPERMRDYLRERTEPAACVHMPEWPLPNVWVGTSIENRRFVGRADLLRETPAAVRFISAEPLLGPLWTSDVLAVSDGLGVREVNGWPGRTAGTYFPALDLTEIDWLIVGGESGPHHRPIREEWVHDLRRAADLAGTAFFFKQWGGRSPKAGGRELGGRTYDAMPSAARRELTA